MYYPEDRAIGVTSRVNYVASYTILPISWFLQPKHQNRDIPKRIFFFFSKRCHPCEILHFSIIVYLNSVMFYQYLFAIKLDFSHVVREKPGSH